jgi:hypothetical protein
VDFGVADFEAGELVGEPVAVDVLELVESGVSGFDDDCGEWQFGESLHLEGECPVGERGREVVEALALDRGEDRARRVRLFELPAKSINPGDGRVYVPYAPWLPRPPITRSRPKSARSTTTKPTDLTPENRSTFKLWNRTEEEESEMPRKSYRPEEIIAKLRQAEVLINQG